MKPLKTKQKLNQISVHSITTKNINKLKKIR